MTIVSTANIASDDKRAELKSFPPLDDTIDLVKQVDWQDVRRRCRAGVNNVGLVVAVVGEKLHDFGVFLAKV